MYAAEGIATLLLLLVLGVATRETPLFLLTLALLMATGSSMLWERYCLVRVEYRRRFSRTRASFGEQVELEIEVVNRKILPLPWLEVEEEIPPELAPLHGRVVASHKPNRSLLTALFALRPFERVRRRYTIPCRARGEHLFGPALLRSGDLFGLATCELALGKAESLVVYPRVVPVDRLGLPARHPLGDLKSESWLFEDTTRIAGAREYRPGDGLRRIHWPSTARTQQLQSRVYEATTSHKVVLFLNVAGGEELGSEYSYDPDVLELGIMAAASLAAWGLEQGYQVGVYTNGLHRGGRGPVLVEPRRDPEQWEKILLALGKLEPLAGRRFEELLAREARRLPFGTTVVVITPLVSRPVAAALLSLRAHGHAVTVVLTGRRAGEARLDGITVRRVGPPEAWQEMTTLGLER